ncbi:hypothetical protein PIB30_114522, partial [Stylosanthes scabra]|nr:hypothetical protein [Stylosanthes scabra]
MGGGDVPQTNEENKAMDIDHEVDVAPIPAADATLVSEQVNEENEGQEATRKGKTSYVWKHFKELPLSETKGEHKAKCNHCRK